jgi:hypothetical protein
VLFVSFVFCRTFALSRSSPSGAGADRLPEEGDPGRRG